GGGVWCAWWGRSAVGDSGRRTAYPTASQRAPATVRIIAAAVGTAARVSPSGRRPGSAGPAIAVLRAAGRPVAQPQLGAAVGAQVLQVAAGGDPGDNRKSTRLNSSHVKTSYAVFCLKKKKGMTA